MNQLALVLIGAIGMGAAIFVGHVFVTWTASKARIAALESELDGHEHRTSRLLRDLQSYRIHAEDRADALFAARDFIKDKTPPFVNGEWSNILEKIENVLPKLALTYQPRDLDDEAAENVEKELSKLMGLKQ